MQGIVPDDVRASFERDGFYVFKGLVDASVLTVRPACASLVSTIFVVVEVVYMRKRADDGRNPGL